MNVAQEIDAPARHLYLLKEDTGEYRVPDGPEEPGAAAGGEQHARIPDAILYCVDLPVGARLLYGALQRHMGLKGCFPSMRTLAGELGVSFRSVENWLQALVARGAVAVTEQGGGRRSNRYALTGQVRSVATDATKPSVATDATQGGDAARSVATDAKQRSTRCLAPKHQMLQSHSHVAKENITIDSTPTELTTAVSRPALEKVAPPEQPTPTVEAKPTEQEPPARAKQASVTPAQPALVELPPAVATVLDTLGLSGVAAVRAVAAIVAAFPAVDHALTSACCAEWCQNNRRKTSASTYSNWCRKEEANGANGGTNRQGAGQGGAGGAPRARAGDHRQPANPQHAAHAAKLDW